MRGLTVCDKIQNKTVPQFTVAKVCFFHISTINRFIAAFLRVDFCIYLWDRIKGLILQRFNAYCGAASIHELPHAICMTRRSYHTTKSSQIVTQVCIEKMKQTIMFNLVDCGCSNPQDGTLGISWIAAARGLRQPQSTLHLPQLAGVGRF